MLVAPLLLLNPAVAQDAPTGPVITGTLESPSGEGLAGVSITVEGNGFSETVTSNEAGEWQVLLPDTGAYQVTLDISTLPGGISLTSEDRAVTSATVISRARPKRIGFL